jgi:hypothetical protein
MKWCTNSRSRNISVVVFLHIDIDTPTYSLASIIRITNSRRMRWAGHVARIGEKRNAYRVLVGKLEGKRWLGRPRRRWVDNIGMDLGWILGWGDVDWTGLAQDRDKWVESSCDFNDKPLGSINAGKLLNGYTTGNISSTAQLHRVSLVVTLVT